MNDTAPTHKLGLIGDNGPPADPLAAQLAEDHAALLTERTDLELAAAKLPREVNTDEDCAKITAFVVKAKALAKKAVDAHTPAKAPVLQQGRTIDAFFFSIRDGAKAKADDIEKRNAPFLRAKADAEAARRREEEAAKRRAADEAKEREAEERRQREAAEREAEAARRRIADAETAEARGRAEADARAAERNADLARKAEEQATADAAKATKSADRDSKAAAKGLGLSRTASGGGVAKVTKTWRWRMENQGQLLQSLGPLASYLGDDAVKAALDRATKADPRPAIPGIAYWEEEAVKTTATRAS